MKPLSVEIFKLIASFVKLDIEPPMENYIEALSETSFATMLKAIITTDKTAPTMTLGLLMKRINNDRYFVERVFEHCGYKVKFSRQLLIKALTDIEYDVLKRAGAEIVAANIYTEQDIARALATIRAMKITYGKTK